MEKIKLKFEQFNKALQSFDEVINLYQRVKSNKDAEQISFICDDKKGVSFDFDRGVLVIRDSLIQRFEYSVDTLWKYLKNYLEIVAKVAPEIQGPKHIIRTCCNIGLLSEDDSQMALSMIDSRNLTSHMYKEEIAEIVCKDASQYYSFMKKIAEHIKPF